MERQETSSQFRNCELTVSFSCYLLTEDATLGIAVERNVWCCLQWLEPNRAPTLEGELIDRGR